MPPFAKSRRSSDTGMELSIILSFIHPWHSSQVDVDVLHSLQILSRLSRALSLTPKCTSFIDWNSLHLVSVLVALSMNLAICQMLNRSGVYPAPFFDLDKDPYINSDIHLVRHRVEANGFVGGSCYNVEYITGIPLTYVEIIS